MSFLPWPIQNALDNRVRLGSAAVAEYWETIMSTHQRNAVDRWLMSNRLDLLQLYGKGPQHWRFKKVIEALYRERPMQARIRSHRHAKQRRSDG